ncbi:MAG: hypothetical protein ACPG4T_18375 [Nannocystaceae bacterium]
MPRHEALVRWGAALVEHIDDYDGPYNPIQYAFDIVLGVLALEAHQAADSPTYLHFEEGYLIH